MTAYAEHCDWEIYYNVHFALTQYSDPSEVIERNVFCGCGHLPGTDSTADNV
jgi:hypothetical protein